MGKRTSLGIAWVFFAMAWVALSSGAAAQSLGVDYAAERMAKAPVDECFNGKGEPYIPYDPDLGCPADAIPKRNGSYAWGLAASTDYMWVGTAANVPCVGAAFTGGWDGVPGIMACEGLDSQYAHPDGTSLLIQAFLGDWRPPEIYAVDRATGEQFDVTPDDKRILETIGLRSAGESDGVVLLAGPTIYGINFFAFDARTRRYLGSETLLRYTDIRKWLKYDGVLYVTVQDAFGGEGTVLRWRGNRWNPFRFEVVGELDNEGANLCVHENRLYVGTWRPTPWSSLSGLEADTPPAGVWMSPEIPGGGLRRWHSRHWSKVFSVDEYEPDPINIGIYGLGDLASHNGYLYFGTMHTPAFYDTAFEEVAGRPPSFPEQALLKRAFALFRAKDLDDPENAEIEVLYGHSALPVYNVDTDSFDFVPTGMGAPVNGPESSGFGNPDNNYCWVLSEYFGDLFVGTSDVKTGPPPYSDPTGGDLYVFAQSDDTADLVDDAGAGNAQNGGFRTILSLRDGLWLGTANPSNIHPDGGWELLRLRHILP